MRVFRSTGNLIFSILTPLILITILGLNINKLEGYAAEDWVEEIVTEANDALSELTTGDPVMGVVYLCDTYDAKDVPNGGTVTTVYSGQTVNILGVKIDDDYNVWLHTQFMMRGTEYRGYILRENIATSDARFLAWEEEYGMKPEYWKFDYSLMTTFSLGEEPDGTNAEGADAGDGSGTEGEGQGETSEPPYSEEIMAFPESYRAKLKELKDLHPDWIFVKQATGLDFQTAVNEEMKGARSLVSKSFEAGAKEWTYDNGNWYYASEEILAFYLDPRTALTEDRIFQFEQLTYNVDYHNEEALEVFLANTFMRKTNEDGTANFVPESDMSYAHLIDALGKEPGVRSVSPYHLAARIIQEQGVNGGSALISGNYPGYEGYYNYFNIGATGASNTEYIINGLNAAKKYYEDNNKPRGAYFALEWGANLLYNGYISKGQDTLYLQKYNVSPSAYYATYTHQYMQNVSAPISEGTNVKSLYAKSGVLNSAFVFKIPVYENMPEEPCVRPYTTTKLYIKLPEGAGEKGVTTAPSVWIDGVEKASAARNGYLVIDTETREATSAIVYKYNEKGNFSGMYVWLLNESGGAYAATYEPELEDLLTSHGFSIRITGKSGIRFKTGIDPATREKLINEGIDGYKLKEYGTLVMNNSMRSKYPFILGGNKVLSGASYGHDENGNLIDKIFETGSEGRYRFTSVMTGLPVDKYKNVYAFRGYIILNNGTRDVTLYAGVSSRSIYSVAQTLIEMNVYPEGSSVDLFIRKLISDADALETAE